MTTNTEHLERGPWQPIDTAPYSLIVEIKVGRRKFRARLLEGFSMDSDERPCDQWMADVGERYPECWSDGCCWESNADSMMSAQPTHWRPLL